MASQSHHPFHFMAQNKKQQYNNENYIPMMIVIQRTQLTPRDIKKVLGQRCIVHKEGSDLYIFSASTNTQQKIRQAFPDINFVVQNSNNDIYREAIRSQNRHNLDVYKEENPQGDTVYVVITSTGLEGQKATLAEKFLNEIFMKAPDIRKAHVSYRSWLRSTLKEFANECDVAFRYTCKQYEIIRPRDKAIVVKGYLTQEQAEEMVNELVQLQYPPQCLFFQKRIVKAPIVREEQGQVAQRSTRRQPAQQQQQQRQYHRPRSVNIPPPVNIAANRNTNTNNNVGQQNQATIVINLEEYTNAVHQVEPVVRQMFPGFEIYVDNNRKTISIKCPRDQVRNVQTKLQAIKINNESIKTQIK